MTNSDASDHIQQKIAQNIHTLKSYLSGLGEFQLGILFSIFILICFHILYACVSQALFVLALFNFISFFMVLFCIFSMYTWVTLIYGKHWSDTSIYVLFLISSLSEFLSQWFTYNTQLNVKFIEQDSAEYKDHSKLFEGAQCSVIMACISIILIYLSNFNQKVDNSFVFVSITCVTRFYGSFYFSNVVPEIVSAYFSYLCALAGCLFSHYVNRCLRELSVDSIIENDRGQRNVNFSCEDDSIAGNSDEKRQMMKGVMKRKISNANSNHFKRRTSLPTIPIKYDKYFPDNLLLNEIQNQIYDILNNNDDILSEHIFKSLKVIKNLIIQAKINSELPIYENSDVFNKSSHKNQSANSGNTDADLTKQKAFSLLSSSFIPVIKHQRSVCLKNSTCQYFEDHEQIKSDLRVSLSMKTSASGEKTSESNDQNKQQKSVDKIGKGMNNPSGDNKGENANNVSPDSDESNINKATIRVKTSDYDSCESPNNSDCNSDTEKLSLKRNFENSNTLNEDIEESKEESDGSLISFNKNSIEEEIKKLDLLETIDDWNFAIFDLYEKSDHNVLSCMAYKVFQRVGLFSSFKIPIEQFINYFTALENGYYDLPYHNKIHAADVLHACYYLTTSSVPGFDQTDTSTYKTELKRQRKSLSISQTSDHNANVGYLGKNFTPLELLALYCSAAMHDYDHPGRNNQFLITNKSPLALLYNDKSVLENHHASASWRLLKSDSKYNFLSNLDTTEWKKFRSLVIENILATDLSKHFSIIADFNNKSKRVTSETGNISKIGLDWNSEADRLLVGQMIIKLADINAPLKEKSLHIQWTERICEEFYQQGEEELKLGLPQSPHMDRKNPKMAKLQESFISVLVGSLCNPYESAKLLPGKLIDDPDSISIERKSSIIESLKEKLSDNKKEVPKVFYSELSSNLKSNYKMWCEIMQLEDDLNSN